LLDIIGKHVEVVDPEVERQAAVDSQWLIDESEDTFEIPVDVLQPDSHPATNRPCTGLLMAVWTAASDEVLSNR